MLKGSYTAPNKSQPSSIPGERAESSEAERSGDAGSEVKTKQTHSSCHLTSCRLAARWQYSHNPKHGVCTATTFLVLDTLEIKDKEQSGKEKITGLPPRLQLWCLERNIKGLTMKTLTFEQSVLTGSHHDCCQYCPAVTRCTAVENSCAVRRHPCDGIKMESL